MRQYLKNTPASYLCAILICLYAASTTVAIGAATDTSKSTDQPAQPATKDEGKLKNWLLAPILSSGPKLGFSGGALAGYLHKFDKLSPTSMAVLSASYSNTHSFVGGLFGKAYWDEDRQRSTVGYFVGRANNDYNNFQNTGTSISVQSDLKAYVFEYQHRIKQSSWLFGGYYVHANFNPTGLNDMSQVVMDELDYSQAINAGLGAILTYDTRNNVNNPLTGSFMEGRYTRFSKTFGGDNNYNSWNLQYSYYQALSKKWSMAYNTSLLSTPDAPPSSQATLRNFRGYTSGEDSAENAWIGQIEAHYAFHPRWYAAAFGGVATLVDKTSELDESGNWYPMGGFGARYILKEASQIVLRLDMAWGKAGNRGLYLKIGQPF